MFVLLELRRGYENKNVLIKFFLIKKIRIIKVVNLNYIFFTVPYNILIKVAHYYTVWL